MESSDPTRRSDGSFGWCRRTCPAGGRSAARRREQEQKKRTCRFLRQRKRYYFAVAIAAIFALGLLGLGSGDAWGRRSISSLRGERSSTSRQIKNVQKSLRKVKSQQAEVTGEIDAAQRRLHSAKARLGDAERQLKKTESELSQTKAEIEKTEKKLADHEAALGERLRAVQKKGPATYLAVILDSTDFTDLSTRTYLCQKVVQADTDLLKEIRDQKADLAVQKARLEDKRAARLRITARIETEKREIERARAAKQQTLKKVMTDRKKLEQALTELEHESKALEAEIRRLTAPGSRYRYSGRWTGSLGNPCPGARFTSGFGMRLHPILNVWKMHTGVDLAASYGTRILAAADGMVIFTGWRRGYGKTVIIDHGSGISTLYGHCSSYLTSSGRIVKRGQAIARMGSTGLSTGNHVHFEKRIGGVPRNPM